MALHRGQDIWYTFVVLIFFLLIVSYCYEVDESYDLRYDGDLQTTLPPANIYDMTTCISHIDVSPTDTIGKTLTLTPTDSQGCIWEVTSSSPNHGIVVDILNIMDHHQPSSYLFFVRMLNDTDLPIVVPVIGAMNSNMCHTALSVVEDTLTVYARGFEGTLRVQSKHHDQMDSSICTAADTMLNDNLYPDTMSCPRCAETQMYHDVAYGHEGIVFDVPEFSEFNPTDRNNTTVFDVSCPLSCKCTIHYREWRMHCPPNAVIHTFLVYPNDTTKVTFTNQGLSEFPTVEAFPDLTSLTELYLGENRLTHLPPGVFKHLGNLQQLHLYSNNISLIESQHDPSTVFEGLGNLNILNLKFNRLSYVQPGVFNSTPEISKLFLGYNELFSLSAGVFDGLEMLEFLDLSYNPLTYLPQGLFSRMVNLNTLDLRNNILQALYNGIFDDLYMLQFLYLYNNSLEYIQKDVFRYTESIAILKLSYNALAHLECGLFDGLRNLEYLYLNHNELKTLPSGIFNALPTVTICDLSSNRLLEVDSGLFQYMNNITFLYLNGNDLTDLEGDVFAPLVFLMIVDLSSNHLTELPLGLFDNQAILDTIYLNYNKLTTLPRGVFGEQLSFLKINHNHLIDIDAGAFSGVESLQSIELNHNNLSELKQGVFDGMTSLLSLDISSNRLESLSPGLFRDCGNLETLNIKDNNLGLVTMESFTGLTRTAILVDRYATCCFVQKAKCFAAHARGPFLTCKKLLPFNVLSITVWFLGVFAIIGNIAVISYRWTHFTQQLKIQLILITNLAMSDCLMGVYLIVISSANVYYGKYFPSYADAWREGFGCQFASVLSVLSGEASVFFLTLISIDRFLGVRFPFKRRILGTKVLLTIISSLWFLAFMISTIPIMLSGVVEHINDVSEVCTSLPLVRRPIIHTENRSVILFTGFWNISITEVYYEHSEVIGTKPGMHYSLFTFVGINLTCFLVVAFCYSQIFILARRSSKGAGRNQGKDEEFRMAVKMFAVVCTDFCCWVPTIIVCVLVQGQLVTVSPIVYAWIVAFILPINSSINPFVYTFMARMMSSPRRKDSVSQQ